MKRSAQSVGLGILGHGTVGSAVVELLEQMHPRLLRSFGRHLRIDKVAVRDVDKHKQHAKIAPKLTSNPFEVVESEKIKVVIELMGGETPALELILSALEHGKHVITANKLVMAKYGEVILHKAQQNGVSVRFEASVCGALPVIQTLQDSLAANSIRALTGIVNGTCNFILTTMTLEQSSFEQALEQAQKRGYAEADPSSDIECWDAAYKLIVLSHLCFGTALEKHSVLRKSIGSISGTDIQHCREMGYRIKPLVMAVAKSEGLELRAHPTLVPEKHILAQVEGVLNGLVASCDWAGDIFLQGSGAGAKPTASAVVGDVLDVLRRPKRPHSQRRDTSSVPPLINPASMKSAHYLMMHVRNQTGVLASIAQVISTHHISIEKVQQKHSHHLAANQVQLILITEPCSEQNMQAALTQAARLDCVEGPIHHLPILP